MLRVTIKAVIDWREALDAIERFTTTFDGSQFAPHDADRLHEAARVVVEKIRKHRLLTDTVKP